MRCPFCRYRDTRVTDSRMTDDGIRRRRQCIACGERFTTLETVQRAAVQVVKRDGRREDFNREKLLAGLRRACTKRNIPAAELEAIVAEIEARVMAEGKPEVPSSVVGELAMDALRKLDHIAYIRFASVYRAFADLEELKEALRALEEGRVPTAEERMLQLPLIDEATSDVPPRPRVVAGRATRRATGTDGE